MSESSEHIELVNMIKQYVIMKHPHAEKYLFRIDCGDSDYKPPQMINGYTPDFLYEWNGVLIIGEAKTPFDLERPHSNFQFQSFLRYCEQYNGVSFFILATSWDFVATGKNLLKRLYKDINCSKTKIDVISRITIMRDLNAEN